MEKSKNAINAAMIADLRARLGLTQEQLAEQLGVAFATVNRWETGAAEPRQATLRRLEALATAVNPLPGASDAALGSRIPEIRRGRRSARVADQAATKKPMEQMLWDAACSIRGEKDAAKFKDFLLPLLFLKRLSDVFDDEIERLAETFGSRDKAIEMAEFDHSLVRFYVPIVARWGVINGRKTIAWSDDERPRDIGQHLTTAVRAISKQNPDLSGVIDNQDFADERNGERDINPAKLRAVVETFSDPRYRLGLNDVAPDFLGSCYEYLLRKFAEGSGQSAGEFFTPTEVGKLMALIMQPKPGEECHDYACGSGGLLVQLQIVARNDHPESNVPLKLFGQELQAESFAVAKMNGIIHDMEIEVARGDSMINPKFRRGDGSMRTFDIVVANPMWNQTFAQAIYEGDQFERFAEAGGATSGKGDWAWLQHTLACMNERGRAAVVLDTGALTRGSGSKNEDRERNIRKWFVDNDLIESVILLPDNLFYNTSAAGVVVILNRRKAADRGGKIVLVNAARSFQKGRPKNYLPDSALPEIRGAFLGSVATNEENSAVIPMSEIALADYNLSPKRWVGGLGVKSEVEISMLISRMEEVLKEEQDADATLRVMLSKVHGL